MSDKPLSENLGKYDGGNYIVTAAIWRTNIEGHLYDTYEIGIRAKALNGNFTLLQSDKYNHQTVQEVANAIAMLLADQTQSYTPEWCQRMFT